MVRTRGELLKVLVMTRRPLLTAHAPSSTERSRGRVTSEATTPGLRVTARPGLLVVSFDDPVRACSWAIVGGGIVETRSVAWIEVRNADLGPHVDPRELVLDRLRSAGLAPGIRLLTGRSVATYEDAIVSAGRTTARCLATIGLSNALRAGDPARASAAIGTINLLAYVDEPLSDEGLIEASAIATEAKCAAVFESGVKSRESGRPATGTGTDCVVIASPRAHPGQRVEAYAGKHTVIGSAVGAAVERAVAAGVRRWREQTGL
jgi:adenosylcobinamide amidohydrolase